MSRISKKLKRRPVTIAERAIAAENHRLRKRKRYITAVRNSDVQPTPKRRKVQFKQVIQ